ncbi:MAG TPA: ADP-ribosylglycohydrolase family protein [Bacteroidales bacterium]|nr:ADP-ribosylglycohydrolase family protein [Bacteroidales bacterium]
MKIRSSILTLLFTLVSSIYTCAQTYEKPKISLMIWDDRAIEGSDRAELQLFQIGTVRTDLVVRYAISGTAKNGYDYRIGNSITMRSQKATLIIKPVDDFLTEGDETVTLALLPDDAYDIDPANAVKTIIIQDNELPDIQFLLPSSSQPESATAEIELSLSKKSDTDVRADYKIHGYLIQDPASDFRNATGSIVIPAGSTVASIPLDIMNDNIPEDDETIIVEIVSVANSNIGLNEKHFYTILNDDGDVPRSSVYDKIYGILLGSRGGSSLGAVVEGVGDMNEIERLYGVFNEFLPCNHYDVYWSHPAGGTEDGIERQKCISTAIIEKQDRIIAEDIMKVWVRDLEIKDMYYMTQPYDKILLAFTKWGCKPEELPKSKYGGMPFDLGHHIHLTARVFHPIPAINAGDPEGAIKDTKEIGRLFYEDINDDAFAWGGLYNAAIALAMLPEATVESVIKDAMKYATPDMRTEIEHGLSIAAKYSDPMDKRFREELNRMYEDPESPYCAEKRMTSYIGSSVYENVTCAFAILKASGGNVELAVKIANNRGRDTDCTAASAGGLAGALTGISTVPQEWIDYLEKGTLDNPYTNSHIPNRATAQAIYRALQNKLQRMDTEVKTAEKRYRKKLPPEIAYEKRYIDLMRKSDVLF